MSFFESQGDEKLVRKIDWAMHNLTGIIFIYTAIWNVRIISFLKRCECLEINCKEDCLTRTFR